jgi:glycosyltransferase involved in cell wall biosynthesis
MALASGTSVIVGDVPFFAEFKGYLPVCDSTEDYVKAITKIFEDPAYEKQIKDNTNRFINERTWERVAEWYLSCTPDKDFTAKVGLNEDQHPRLV